MSTKSRPVYINACAMLNPLGADLSTIADGLFAGNTAGVKPWPQRVIDREVYTGIIEVPLLHVPEDLSQFACRNNQLLMQVAEQLRPQLEALRVKYASERIAVILGTSTSGILAGENAVQALHDGGSVPAGYHYRQQEIGTPAIFLRALLDLKGPALTISTACSSSAKVFASAKRMLQAGLCDAAIVGGADSLCKLTVFGFSSLESVSRSRCNPMSINRDGINVGEAAALLIISRDEDEIELLATGESSDAHHMSAPHPQGRGAINAMRAALTEAGLSAADIAYINLHGTATQLNDAMESLAVQAVFDTQVPCSSTKPLTGHTLGAAGATEAGFCWLVLSAYNTGGQLPPHVWDGVADPQLPRLNLVTPEQGINIRPGTALLSNSFAFGGNNASVILRKV